MCQAGDCGLLQNVGSENVPRAILKYWVISFDRTSIELIVVRQLKIESETMLGLSVGNPYGWYL